ncbi:MAG: DUF2141 domain-containing protein [Paludibacter sp.]|nr:DUF2141 domain-containing protein [Paludibacter sp.]
MRYLNIIFIILLLKPLVVNSQNKITIEIGQLQNNKGEVLFLLMDINKNIVQELSGNIKGNKCNIYIENIKTGKYAFKYFHDENKNKKLDTNWISIPKEGYGFSNNAKGKFGPPEFDKMVFEITNDTTIKCSPNYITF